MAYFYSAENGGFYVTGVHASMPADAVAITDAEHAAMMAAQAEGKLIVPGPGGKPKAENPPALTPEQLAASREASRAAAYRDESDPLYFKAQRGEATMQEWLDKIDEIKARFP